VDPRHLYVHVPFCARRCAYCDFAIAVRRNVPVDEYLASLEREIESKVSTSYRLESVYLGGGTPSRLGKLGIERTMDLVRSRFELQDDTEITIEANPDDVDANQAAAWRGAGVNRVSLGIQSFDDSVLQWMHRIHNASGAINAFRTLRGAGFDNISVDLIFALPQSLNRSWESDLTKALELEPEHVSLYGLTIEHSTPLGRWRDRGSVIAADEDTYAAEFLMADRMMSDAGFDHYEVSNFAKPGRRSRHNSAYWSGAPYVVIGPSAHSYDGEGRSWNVPQYTEWVSKLSLGESVVVERERLTYENRIAEKVYLGLRTNSGLEISESDKVSADRWRSEGWANVEGNRVRLTSEGWLRLDSLAAALTGL
jgi:oxygen-independent coproporphyrinogen-3 oxidase